MMETNDENAVSFSTMIESLDDGELDRAAFTSRWVAAERALESERPDALFVDPFARALGGSSGPAFSENMKATFGELRGWPEYHITWMAVRTRAIDDAIFSFATKHHGIAFQFVNLGAGLDTRPYRLTTLEQNCRAAFEVDQGQVITAKAKAIKNLGAATRCTCTAIPADFVKEPGGLASRLCAAGFDSTCPTFWLLEGLTMYLPEWANCALLREISELSAAGSSLCCGFIADTSNLVKDVPYAPSRQEMEALAAKLGWSDVRTVAFGEPELHYGGRS